MVKKRRRTLLKKIGAASAASSMAGVASAKKDSKGRERRTEKDGRFNEITEVSESLDRLTNDYDFHPAQDRAAFVSASFGQGIELYVAEGVSSLSEVPSNVYQISDDLVGGAFDPEWEKGNRLSYQQNLSRVSVKVPRSYKKLEHKVEEESVLDEDSMVIKDKRGEN